MFEPADLANACLATEYARLHEAGEQVPLLRDHVRQLIHLRLEERDLLGSLDELKINFTAIDRQQNTKIFGVTNTDFLCSM